jgi:hypothetical protein
MSITYLGIACGLMIRSGAIPSTENGISSCLFQHNYHHRWCIQSATAQNEAIEYTAMLSINAASTCMHTATA